MRIPGGHIAVQQVVAGADGPDDDRFRILYEDEAQRQTPGYEFSSTKELTEAEVRSVFANVGATTFDVDGILRAARSALGRVSPQQSDRCPQPYDGLAKEDADGIWRVFRVGTTGRLMPLAGPFSNQKDAIEQLRALVAAHKGDRWVVDRNGAARIVN